jgi:hypothetical protein
MLGINIISKTGILVFSHSFTSSFNENIDAELHAGLMSAVFNALRETQRESNKSIRQRDDYIYLLYEGVLTFGVSPSKEENPRFFDFLRDVILKFELKYTKDLHLEAIIDRSRFDEFHEEVDQVYKEVIEVDVKSLNYYLEILAKTNFPNCIIYGNE